jgi:glycosyltransferase involved in cell wall biosynthesis
VNAIGGKAFLLTSPVLAHGERKAGRRTVFTIGWVGAFAGTHRQSLINQLFPALQGINMRVRLILIGVRSRADEDFIRRYFLNNPRVELDIPLTVDWQDETMIHRRIARFDVGIATLGDGALDEARSAFKLKQYMSCGVPVLGSAKGENGRFLRHGQNGFVCENAGDLERYLTHVHGFSGEAYAALSTAALRTSREFDLAIWSRTFARELPVAAITEAPLYIASDLASSTHGTRLERTGPALDGSAGHHLEDDGGHVDAGRIGHRSDHPALR